MSLKLKAAIALVAATFCIPSTAARKLGHQTGKEKPVFLRLTDMTKTDGFDVQMRGDEIVGMTAVRKDGSRVILNHQSNPTCATSCPAGQKIYCWKTKQSR